jgi:hypothetical protein
LSAIDAMSQLGTRRYRRLRGVKHAWGAPIPEGASQLGRGRSDGFSREIGGHRARRRGNSGYSGEESRRHSRLTQGRSLLVGICAWRSG